MFSSPIMTPVIFGSILMSIERTSAPIRNKYGDNGSPCLHPLLTEISSDKKPHCSIYAFISVLNIFTHFMKFLSKPNISRILYKNFHDKESNAFSKSISINRADCLFTSVLYIMSYISLVLSLLCLPGTKPF